MFSSKLVTVLAAAVGASAFIGNVQPYGKTYIATSTSTLPVTFNTFSTMVEFLDLTVSFGIATPADHAANNTLGVALVNFDLVKLGHSSTGPGNFTLNVPIKPLDLYAGSGAYVLTAAVLRGTGVSQVIDFRADAFQLPFNATTA